MMINPSDNAIVDLFTEQTQKKAELEMHLQFDFLGIDNYPIYLQRYTAMKLLAARIIAIENLLDTWAASVTLTGLMDTQDR